MIRLEQAAAELRRRQYLDVLGVNTYVSRYQLPGAAPSSPVAMVAATPSLPEAAAPAEAQLQDIPLQAAESHPPAATAEIKPVNVAEKFTLGVVFAGGWLWLDDLAGASLGSEYQHLFNGLLFALGRKEQALSSYQFNWPVHQSQQLDLGAEAAREAVAGFIGRLLASSPCEGLVLMGASTSARVDAAQLGLKKTIHTVSAQQMLAEPSLKKIAWQDLQPLRRNR